MRKRDIVLVVVLSCGAAAALFALAAYLFVRRRRSKREDDEDGTSCAIRADTSGDGLSKNISRLNGFLNLKTPLISTKTLGSESNYKLVKAEASRKQKRSLFSFSESEDEERSTVPPPALPSIAEAGPSKKPRKRSSKPASVPQAAPPTPSSSSCGGVLLSSDSEDEKEAQRVRGRSDGLVSNLTRRVAGGVLKRSARRAGDTFVELRVYNSKDVLAAADWKERLEQANVALRYQADYRSPEFDHLKTFLRMVKSNFTEAEGKFYSANDKK